MMASSIIRTSRQHKHPSSAHQAEPVAHCLPETAYPQAVSTHAADQTSKCALRTSIHQLVQGTEICNIE